MLYSSRLFLFVSIGCCKNRWLYFSSNDDISYDRLVSAARRSCWLEPNDRSIGGAYLLVGMRARKWRAERNAGARVDSEDRKESGYGSTWWMSLRASDATLLHANENPTPDSVVLYVRGSNWQERLAQNEEASQSDRMILNCPCVLHSRARVDSRPNDLSECPNDFECIFVSSV